MNKSSDFYCSLSLKTYQGSLLYYTSIDCFVNDKDKIKIKKARNQILRSYIIKFSINLLSTMCINLFSTNVPFLSLPENVRKPPVFQCFQGVKKWNMVENRLKFISTKTKSKFGSTAFYVLFNDGVFIRFYIYVYINVNFMKEDSH